MLFTISFLVIIETIISLNCTGHGRNDCNTTSSNITYTSVPTVSNFTDDNDGKPSIPNIAPTMTPTIDMNNGRNDTNRPPTIPTTQQPTLSPVQHDSDTNPTKAPNILGYEYPTLSPTSNTSFPTQFPTQTPITTTALYTSTSVSTQSSTAIDNNEGAVTDIQIQTTDLSETESNAANNNGMRNTSGNILTILFSVIGILSCVIFIGIFYFLCSRKSAAKRSKALQFRSDANQKVMELDNIKHKSNSFDADNYNNKTNLLIQMDDEALKISDNVPGASLINKNNDDIMLQAETTEGTLNITINDKVSNAISTDMDVDNLDDNNYTAVAQKVTDDGYDDMEIIDDANRVTNDGYDDMETIDDVNQNDMEIIDDDVNNVTNDGYDDMEIVDEVDHEVNNETIGR